MHSTTFLSSWDPLSPCVDAGFGATISCPYLLYVGSSFFYLPVRATIYLSGDADFSYIPGSKRTL